MVSDERASTHVAAVRQVNAIHCDILAAPRSCGLFLRVRNNRRCSPTRSIAGNVALFLALVRLPGAVDIDVEVSHPAFRALALSPACLPFGLLIKQHPKSYPDPASRPGA
ncbi:MAG: hypothetical protein ACPIOQ_03395 [Promethearchaeia archaeon]